MNTNTGEIYESIQEGLKSGIKQTHLMPLDEASLTPYQRNTMKIQRNDPCPCGSGLKFKKCHLGKEYVQTNQERPMRGDK